MGQTRYLQYECSWTTFKKTEAGLKKQRCECHAVEDV